jgi:hypothetical protein
MHLTEQHVIRDGHGAAEQEAYPPSSVRPSLPASSRFSPSPQGGAAHGGGLLGGLVGTFRDVLGLGAQGHPHHLQAGSGGGGAHGGEARTDPLGAATASLGNSPPTPALLFDPTCLAHPPPPRLWHGRDSASSPVPPPSLPRQTCPARLCPSAPTR